MDRFKMNNSLKEHELNPSIFKYIILVFFIILIAVIAFQTYMFDKKITKEEEKITELETMVIGVHNSNLKQKEDVNNIKQVIISHENRIETLEKK